MHIHNLDGCAPVPLAHYLKALGILRLVAEQADDEVRGWWDGDRFRIMTRLSREELETFFLTKYAPTPLASPWNKGSGYFYENDPGLAPVEHSIAPRFSRLRDGIRAGRELLNELSLADRDVRAIKGEAKEGSLTKAQRQALKDSAKYKKRLSEVEKKFKSLKADLIPRIRLAWRGPHREWMDAAMVLDDNGKPRFPALLGTGGNDGRLDFTNNFMQRLNDVFDLADAQGTPRTTARSWFRSALWGEAADGCRPRSAVGQYLPGSAGGANSANGPDAKPLVNPVDFVLTLEGAVLFTAHATRRMGAVEQSRAAAPFAIAAQGAGYASASDTDESARGEQWMPLWSQPMTHAELRRLLAEGRAQIGARSAREPLDLARAIARLGTARGVTAFQRYGYIERNGESNLAVPLGRFLVPDRIHGNLACLDDLDAWLVRLRREARDSHAPARLQLVEKRLADALFAVSQHPEEPDRWRSLLQSFADVEAVQVTGSGYRAGPVPRLRPEWVRAADDGSPEFRLALACALQCGRFRSEDRLPIDAIRRHWLPLDKKGPGRFATTGTDGQSRLQIGPDVVMQSRSGIDDAIALVARRLIEASQRGERRLPLLAARRACAAPTDLATLVAGEVDMNRTLALARALMAVDGDAWARTPCPSASAPREGLPDDAWIVIRLALLPWPLSDGRRIGTDPAILRRLQGGDATTAVDLALRRLAAAGINSPVRVATVEPETARLWAAALAFPITQSTADAFVRRLDPNFQQGD